MSFRKPDCRVCPKLRELKEILAETLADPETKILIFSEWERMTRRPNGPRERTTGPRPEADALGGEIDNPDAA